MSAPSLRTLEGVPLAQLHEAFMAAFADYSEPIRMDQAGFATLLQRRGFDAALSAGAFAGETLVAFHLICKGEHGGRPSAYDTGTGVLPAWRGQRLSQALFTQLLPIWQAAGLTQCVLEVIDTNTPARRSYEACGFAPVRRFDCLTLPILPPDALPAGVQLREVSAAAVPAACLAWLAEAPSWQNSPASLARSPRPFVQLRQESDGRPLAIGVLHPDTGDVPLFAVRPEARRLGLGTALIASLRGRSTKPLRFINLTEGSASVALLQRLGAEINARQFEMIWRWD
ncbi:GNAT family N-acetyltransferase [Chitinimonas sp. BJYL2]|uniref:GNAT family N-acetyltransferase n=1 Tax=Chitinimonas sp. BJYL2 TaxID=2976696 RepID=UPI0022B41453|nr:GNAT family N-acetyltransferase [Chitinimonas sp. BJYL2]